ncbi:glycosyltransferase [Enterococcus faecium]|nr:glycosyltransferase [Enterococcus faecium]
MKENPLVSIITVCYNSSLTIEDTIKAVLNQTYRNWEHIIVDGGSKDDTIGIIKKYEYQYLGRLKLHQGPDKGIYDAMNKGIGFARGEIIGIINSDDWYSSDALEQVVNSYLSVDGNEKIITGGLNRVRGNTVIYNQMHREISLGGLKKGMPLQHPAVFVTKAVYDRMGTFDISYPHIADYDFIWRCYADGNVKFLFVDSVVSFMRDGGASDCLSWKHIWSRTTERLRLRRKYISPVEAFVSCCKFFLKEICFQLVKASIGTNNVKRIYDFKREVKANIKKSAHSINKILMKAPAFRNALVYTYHFVRKIIFGAIRRATGYKTGFLTKGNRITPAGMNCYFGYYDKTPFSPNGSHYLYLMVNGKGRPKLGEAAKVCYASSESNYEVIGVTLAWNFQQGAMLRFISEDVVAWNDYDCETKSYISILYNLKSKEKRVLSAPMYDVSDNGKYGISLDFERLNVDAEGYGYIQNGIKDHAKDTYISIVDIESGQEKIILTTEQLIEKYPIPKEATFSYFNHLEFNPAGERFNFIFRYVLDQKRVSRLFTADLNGDNIHLLADDEMVSHCTWLDDSHITLWCRLNGKNNYYIIADTISAEYTVLGMNTPKEDGHPSYNKDRTIMITDTYPDKGEYRHLIVYDCINDVSRDISRLYAPILLHGPLRCDFHPRWHPNMKQVIIDSVHEGFRGMYLVDIE